MNTLETITRVAVGVATPAVAPVFTAGMSEPYLGAAVNVILAVCAGAIAAVAFVEGHENRKQLAKVALGSVVIGSAVTTLIAEVLKFKFGWALEPKHVSAMGVLVGALMRFVLPPVITRIPKWLDAIRIPFISKPTNKGE